MRGRGCGKAAMIRWILLDCEIDDTATARGREKGRKEEGGAEATGTGRGTGGNKSSGEKRREPSKNKKRERKIRSLIKEGPDLLFLFLISTLPSLRGGGPSPRAFLISLKGSAAPFLLSSRATDGGGGRSHIKRAAASTRSPLRRTIRPEKHPSACLNTTTP